MTIKDIAKLSGYAVGTVSRVLNNRPDVSEEARAKVMAVVEAHHFTRNSNAKHLKQQASSGVALIVKGTQNMLFADLVERIQTRIRDSGYPSLIYYIDEDDDEIDQAIRVCRERRPMGILFLGSNLSLFRAGFHSITIPCVLVTNSAAGLDQPNLSSVSTDDTDGARRAVERLMELGAPLLSYNEPAKTVTVLVIHSDGTSRDFTVETEGFVALVDAVGGVDFYVPCDMDYDDPTADPPLHIHYTEGMTHLDGQEAMEVVRFRHNNDGSGYGSEDIGRMQTQQNFLKAVAQQTLTLSNLDKIDEFVKIFQTYVDTDLTLGNLAWLGKEAISMGAENISFSTLPGEWHSPYIYLDPDATLEVVNQYLNPYVEDRTMEDLDIPS